MDDILAPDLVIKKVTKKFGSAPVLREIDLTIRGGEFVGLMGPNGAGKSTLIKILGGIYTATSGEIQFGGKTVSHLGDQHEVGFIHQDLGLVDELSISENLRLGESPMRLLGPILDKRAELTSAQHALATIGLEVSPNLLVGSLSPGEKTLVAIARAFARGAKLLFVDEATSTLPSPDCARVIASLEEIVGRGATVVMVSHKLTEILNATHRVVLIIDGKIGADERTDSLGRAGLVKLLAQHERDTAEAVAPQSNAASGSGKIVLQMKGARSGKAGPFNLTLRAGEVLGLTGLPGSGLHDAAYAAHGVVKLAAGERVLAPDALTAFVPPHRETQGGFAEMSIRENLTISSLKRWRNPIGLLNPRRELVDAQQTVESLSVRPANALEDYGVLSGGNKQKIIFGRALLRKAEVYVLCEPTRGVDLSARAEIYTLIRKLRSEDAAILLVSSDAEDLLAVCDNLSLIVNGLITEPRSVSELDTKTMEEIL